MHMGCLIIFLAALVLPSASLKQYEKYVVKLTLPVSLDWMESFLSATLWYQWHQRARNIWNSYPFSKSKAKWVVPIPKKTHHDVASVRFRSTCGMNFVATDPSMWCWINSTHRGSCLSSNRWTWSHMWWFLMCKSRITGMNQSFSFFFDILFRLFDEEKRTLQANARSLTSRGILDTFYNYDQVKIYSDLVSPRSTLVHSDGSLVATDGANLS